MEEFESQNWEITKYRALCTQEQCIQSDSIASSFINLINASQDFLYLKLCLTSHLKGSQKKFSIPIAILLLEVIIHFPVWLWGKWLPYRLHWLLPAEMWNVPVMKKPKIWRIVPHWCVGYDKVLCDLPLHRTNKRQTSAGNTKSCREILMCFKYCVRLENFKEKKKDNIPPYE